MLPNGCQGPPSGPKGKNDTPKKPKLQKENRCNRHRANHSIDTTLKQRCVENDLGPAECAERSAAPPGDGVLDLRPKWTKILNSIQLEPAPSGSPPAMRIPLAE